jgi:hypothetical protein
MIVCAQLMIEDPSTAIYWGSYLLKTCDDVKSLCQQFESIVTNSTLSFNDIAFLEIAEELKAFSIWLIWWHRLEGTVRASGR